MWCEIWTGEHFSSCLLPCLAVWQQRHGDSNCRKHTSSSSSSSSSTSSSLSSFTTADIHGVTLLPSSGLNYNWMSLNSSYQTISQEKINRPFSLLPKSSIHFRPVVCKELFKLLRPVISLAIMAINGLIYLSYTPTLLATPSPLHRKLDLLVISLSQQICNTVLSNVCLH